MSASTRATSQGPPPDCWRYDCGFAGGYREMELRNKVKRAGGKWNPKRRVGEMRYDRVVELGLEERIIEEGNI
jgi:hypothetical protein